VEIFQIVWENNKKFGFLWHEKAGEWMKIIEMRVWPLNLEPVSAFTVAYGSYDVFEYALIELITDTGLSGLGEAAPDTEVTGETQVSVLRDLDSARQAVVGKDPFDMELILRHLEELLPHGPSSRAAVDMALYDLVGKALGVPVYRLLGGKAHAAVPAYPVVPLDVAESMAAVAAQFAAGGANTLKVKIGTTIEEDEARLAAIREAIGMEIRLRVDVNQGWGDADTAIAAIRRLTRFNLDYVEQPVKDSDIDGMAAVCRAVDVPIMADESLHSPADALEIIQKGAADILNIKLMKCGGIYRGLQILALAEAAGLPCIVGSMGESSIASAAGVHLTAAKANILSCEAIGPLFVKNDPAEGFLADLERMVLLPPEAPGLGVRLK
jgi:L-alanine-DL-glutamate epimerase-like enolase superfamily enzyme